MATFCLGRRSAALISNLNRSQTLLRPRYLKQYPRFLQTSNANDQPKIPSFAFAFDIDGVLLRSSKPLTRAHRALSYLQKHRIPFILLTNGGGKSEQERVQQLSELLEVPLDTSMFVQSHTPFAELANGHVKENLKEKCILVVGGEGDKCRRVAEGYGFNNVVTPSDIITAYPALWPFVSLDYHRAFARPLAHNAHSNQEQSSGHPTLKVDAIMVFNDPRDWALDTQLVLDLLLSIGGHLGTLSTKSGDPNLPNRGYQQDGQPDLYFSNPDLFWAASYHLPRLGQGGFQAALEGVFNAVTGGPENGVQLHKKMFGKPTQGTFQFAENRLRQHRTMLQGGDVGKLRSVYMVGDNPESDIRGANDYRSPTGSKWHSILVRSGVYRGGKPAHEPKVIVQDVWDAIRYGLQREGVYFDEMD